VPLSRAVDEPAFSVILAHHAALEGKLLLDALRSECGLTFEACSPEPADILRALRHFRAEVILVADPGDCDHLCDVVRSVHRKHPGCKLVVLLTHRQRNTLPELFRQGVRGVIDAETADIRSLCKCILHVKEGHFWLSASELDIVLEEFSKSCSLQFVNRIGQELLSPRELEVVTLLAEGLTNRDIAGELKISPNTVRNYLSQIFDKVGVSTRTELVRFALASGHSRLAETQGRAGFRPAMSTDNRMPAHLPRVL
jgi:two-component system, NarL family, response regulator DegU